MEYAFVSVPAAAVRRKAGHYYEMTNQLLFGEAVQVLRQKGKLWVRIRSLHDQYEGWVTRNLLEETTEESARNRSIAVTTGYINTILFDGMDTRIPLASSLPFFENTKGRMGNREFIYEGEWLLRNNNGIDPALLELWSRRWLNAPYLWGGRTIFGVDCSGFVQTNFKLAGIDLPRDAWQQVQEGKAVKKLKDAQKGDLAFFDDKDEIVHVGMLLDTEHILHASGKVRIDEIDKKGIINSSSGKRTHQLKAIRRYW